LSKDFGKRFTPQQELSAEQAFWFRMSNPTIKSSNKPPVKVEVSSELPKDKDTTICKLKDTIKSLREKSKDENKCEIATINEELENNVAKLLYENERLCNEINHVKQEQANILRGIVKQAKAKQPLDNTITPTKVVPIKESVILYDSDCDDIQMLKRFLMAEYFQLWSDGKASESLVDKQCLEIAKKELLLENNQLLQQIMSQDVLLTVMNSMSVNGESVNVETQRTESYDKCLNLDAEFLKSKQAYNDLLKNYSQLEKHCISLELTIQLNLEIFQKDKSCDNQNALEILENFEINDLKVQLQDKDTTICKLKEIIKSLRGNNKEEIVNYDRCELETINKELENSVAKLLLENERLCKEINHLHAYLQQHELHANEVHIMRERNHDQLAFVVNHQMTPPHFNTYQSSYNNPQFQQQFPQPYLSKCSPSQSLNFGSIHPTQHYSSTYPSKPQFNNSYIPSSHLYQSHMNHQTSFVPQIAYQSPQAPIQPMTESPFVDSSLAIPVFSPGDDPTACLNKAMTFLTAVASSRGDNGKVILVMVIRVMLLVLEELMQVDRQGLLNATTVKVQDIWLGNALNLSDIGMMYNLGIPDGQAVQTIILNNAAFQNEDLDTYDSDCDDISNAKAVLMANISNYGSDVISEVPYSETYLNDMENQSVHAMHDFEQTPVVDFTDNLVIDDEETLILEEESRSKMSEKEKDPEAIKHNISNKPIDYEKLNRLSEDVGKRFTPQQELSAEQAFWFHMSNPTIESSDKPPVKVEVPSELLQVSLVNESLKKLRFHLTLFDFVVKKRKTPNARTEEIAKKELLLENDQLLQQIMSQDVPLNVMNSMSVNGESLNVETERSESCDKCLNLDAEFLKLK
ncbi:hypothetical protein Tco_0713394, partial [Tanacetum coccineum]